MEKRFVPPASYPCITPFLKAAGNPVLTILSTGKIQCILFALIFCIREAADQVNFKLLTVKMSF